VLIAPHAGYVYSGQTAAAFAPCATPARRVVGYVGWKSEDAET